MLILGNCIIKIISLLGHVRKLNCSSYVHLLSVNKILSSLSDSVQCRRGLCSSSMHKHKS